MDCVRYNVYVHSKKNMKYESIEGFPPSLRCAQPTELKMAIYNSETAMQIQAILSTFQIKTERRK